MCLDGCAASSCIDGSGEVLDISGLDIYSLQSGTGVLNWEHKGGGKESADSANDIIGHITYAKKIFSEKDCENKRQEMYWNKIHLPFVYITAELFNDENHPGAIAAAAMIRYYHKRKLPILARYSIEGSTLLREGNVLKEAVARRVALTIKPCNTSCFSGVISDVNPLMPKLEESKLSEKEVLDSLVRFEDPSKQVISSYTMEIDPMIDDPLANLRNSLDYLQEYAELSKALAAGSYGGSPTSLTGGSALQTEDVGKTHKITHISRGLAALRDWDRKSDFKTFLKHKLPDASERFINHFVDLIDDYHVKKQEQLEENLTKAISGVKKAKATEKIQPILSLGDVVDENLLTNRGKKIRPLTGLDNPKFDEQSGTLYTPKGSFRIYIPSNDTPDNRESFHRVMADPKINQFHDFAMSNWAKVHKMAKAGTLTPNMIMHSAIHGIFSANVPVHMQELMYSHFVDAMKHTGIDPLKTNKFSTLAANWMGRDKPDQLPEHAKEHFDRIKDALTLGSPSKVTERKEGEIAHFSYPQNRMNYIKQYPLYHNKLVDLLNAHRQDGRSASRALMEHKVENGQVPGIASKISRYIMGMLGAANVVVPDTHFVRYLFGLDKRLDGKTIDYLKDVLWNPKNSHLLEGIDRYYAANHDAVKHMLKHPKFKHIFKDDPEQAIFPAFWKNWMGIVPHEQSRGYNTGGYTEHVDHRPFWEAVLGENMALPKTLKGEDDMDDSHLPLRTSQLQQQWEEKYGEIPALMMYYAYIVPQLLHADQIHKMEDLTNNLQKATEQSTQLPLLPSTPDGIVKFQDKHVIPGQVELISGPYRGSKFHLMGEDATHYFIHPMDKSPDEHTNLRKLPKDKVGMVYRIHAMHENKPESIFVHGDQHADPILTKMTNQKLLMHGLDLGGNIRREIFPSRLGWRKSLDGRQGWIKRDRNGTNRSGVAAPQLETIYHNMAHGFFGLGDHVPNTATFKHPKTGEVMSVQERVPDAMHYDDLVGDTGAEHSPKDSINAANKQGILDKLYLMDVIMGEGDRHPGNWMTTEKYPWVHHIDNTGSFNNMWTPEFNGTPSYLSVHAKGRGIWSPLHLNASLWAMGLDPQKLHTQLLEQGVPHESAIGAVNRLEKIRALINQGHPTLEQIENIHRGQL